MTTEIGLESKPGRPRGKPEGRGTTAPLLRPLPPQVAARALGAALEQIEGEAFVVSSAGEVVATNHLGLALLRSPAGVLPKDLLAQARASRRPGGVVPLGRQGQARHWLLAFRAPLDGPRRLRLLAARWGLTPRQAQVLAHLVEGEANKTIAQRLGCSEATVELHVTGLLARAGADCRARLIARFYQGG